MRIVSSFGTDVGRRRARNEDAVLVDAQLGLYVVCDGMGGHAGGEVASRVACDALQVRVRESLGSLRSGLDGDRDARRAALEVFRDAVFEANRAVYDHGVANPAYRGMGATMTAVLVGAERIFVAHVGDSRLYLVRAEQAHQVTTDHTVLTEMVRAGRARPEDARKNRQLNALTRAIGVYASVEPEMLDLDLLPGDALLLCSDGLHNYFEGLNLSAFLAHTESHLAAEEFIAFANRRGGADNISAIVLYVRDGRETAQTIRLRLTLKTLRDLPIFHYLTFTELLRMIPLCELVPVKRNATVIVEDELGDALYIVLEGSVQVHRGGQNLSVLNAGRHFGEMSLIDNRPRSASVTAIEDGTLIRISRESFYEALREDPVMAVKLLWNFIQALTTMVRTIQIEALEPRSRPGLRNPYAPQTAPDGMQAVTDPEGNAPRDDDA